MNQLWIVVKNSFYERGMFRFALFSSNSRLMSTDGGFWQDPQGMPVFKGKKVHDLASLNGQGL